MSMFSSKGSDVYMVRYSTHYEPDPYMMPVSFSTGNRGLAEFSGHVDQTLKELSAEVRALATHNPKMTVTSAGRDGVALVGERVGYSDHFTRSTQEVPIATVLTALLDHLKLEPYVNMACVGHPIHFKVKT
jgi:hypothetical protein